MALDYEQICVQVRDVAREAGEYIALQRKTFSFDRVEFKGAHNLVSYVDKTAERMIVERLTTILPEAGFITEEGTVETRRERLKWIVDPLDGTTNFVHGLPPYCVSIALAEEDEIVVGVVWEVTLRECFYAWKRSKAYMNGNEISVSKVDSLENALVAIGFSYATLLEVEDYLDMIAYYQKNTDGIRRIGSATADLVYVACGRVDAFAQVKLAAWDVAAGALIARQAGAVVTDYSGGNDYIFGREIIAANPSIYEAFKKHVK